MTVSEQTKEPMMVIIPANTDLKERVSAPGSNNSAFKRAIKAAESAIEELSVEFDNWMKDELVKLFAELDKVKEQGLAGEAGISLFSVAHDIKGQASTFGYPTVTEICSTLCHLLENIPDPSRLNISVIEIHINAIKTIVNEGRNESFETKASAISLGLRQMAMKILTQELERAKPQDVPDQQ